MTTRPMTAAYEALVEYLGEQGLKDEKGVLLAWQLHCAWIDFAERRIGKLEQTEAGA